MAVLGKRLLANWVRATRFADARPPSRVRRLQVMAAQESERRAASRRRLAQPGEVSGPSPEQKAANNIPVAKVRIALSGLSLHSDSLSMSFIMISLFAFFCQSGSAGSNLNL